MSSLAAWFIYGDIDWEWWQENARKWSPVVSGALFGAGRNTTVKRSKGRWTTPVGWPTDIII